MKKIKPKLEKKSETINVVRKNQKKFRHVKINTKTNSFLLLTYIANDVSIPALTLHTLSRRQLSRCQSRITG